MTATASSCLSPSCFDGEEDGETKSITRPPSTIVMDRNGELSTIQEAQFSVEEHDHHTNFRKLRKRLQRTTPLIDGESHRHHSIFGFRRTHHGTSHGTSRSPKQHDDGTMHYFFRRTSHGTSHGTNHGTIGQREKDKTHSPTNHSPTSNLFHVPFRRRKSHPPHDPTTEKFHLLTRRPSHPYHANHRRSYWNHYTLNNHGKLVPLSDEGKRKQNERTKKEKAISDETPPDPCAPVHPTERPTTRTAECATKCSTETTTESSPFQDSREKKTKRGNKFAHAFSKAFSHVALNVEHFWNPPHTPITHHAAKGNNAHAVRGGVLLYSCNNAQEHREKADEVIRKARELHGHEGLSAVGFQYRMVLCDAHKTKLHEDFLQDDAGECDGAGLPDSDEKFVIVPPLSHLDESTSKPDMVSTDDSGTTRDEEISTCVDQNPSSDHFCPFCTTRLFHVASNTMIDNNNRKRFIADGDMYEAIARLCQEIAHETMQKNYDLVWVTLWEDTSQIEDGKKHRLGQNNQHYKKAEPIRALVNSNHPLAVAKQHQINDGDETEVATNEGDSNIEQFLHKPTLLITTGRGKVRAGVFSRQHLIVTGMESSTSIALLKEAYKRQLNIVIIDPNVHGERFGMRTFERSMSRIFKSWEEKSPSSLSYPDLINRDLYILSHSASGAQLARYLMEKSEHYLPHIQAVAFTDSTHNIQWTRKEEYRGLCDFLQSEACVYFRCANENRDGADWYLHRAGEVVETDTFWERRFGKIKTCWAGTKEHSLTNWFAHIQIWEHFDKFLNKNELASD